MSTRQALLLEFDHEMAQTRRVLERVPEDRLSWQPHPKSASLGRLATHLAEVPSFATPILEGESFDLAQRGAGGYKPATLGSRQEILDLFDANVARARGLLERAEDEAMLQPWSLLRGGQAIFTLPRAAAWRSMIMSHSIHHRGQFTVYLRLNDRPLPAIYGPSADEQV
jgi:uncharacterized damage-inducible protein DinB